MIYDKLSKISRYKGLHPNIDTAIEFILTHSLDTLPNGKNIIDGDNVYVNVISATTREAAQDRCEFHERYIDLHIDISGEEKIEVSLSAPVPVGEFDETTDSGLCDAQNRTEFLLGDNFIMIFLREPHLPLIVANKEKNVRKCIFKILFDNECAKR
ncbi:YhcH/YjgK/YiaL family protein [Caproiciproducens sp.]